MECCVHPVRSSSAIRRLLSNIWFARRFSSFLPFYVFPGSRLSLLTFHEPSSLSKKKRLRSPGDPLLQMNSILFKTRCVSSQLDGCLVTVRDAPECQRRSREKIRRANYMRNTSVAQTRAFRWINRPALGLGGELRKKDEPWGDLIVFQRVRPCIADIKKQTVSCCCPNVSAGTTTGLLACKTVRMNIYWR